MAQLIFVFENNNQKDSFLAWFQNEGEQQYGDTAEAIDAPNLSFDLVDGIMNCSVYE